MNIFKIMAIGILATYAEAEPLIDTRNQGVIPGTDAHMNISEKQVVVTSCRLTTNVEPQTITAKVNDELKLDTSAWQPATAAPCAAALLLDISDLKGRKAAVSREFVLAEQLLNKIPSTDKVSLYLVGKECRKIAQSSDVSSRHQLVEQLHALSNEAKSGRLSHMPEDMDAVTMLSMACSTAVGELKAFNNVAERVLFVLSDGQDETGGADADARNKHRNEAITAAKNAEVKIVTIGCYGNNNEYRSGCPWMQSVATETGGMAITAQKDKALSLNGSETCTEEEILFRIARLFEIKTGGFTIDCKQMTAAADIKISLKPADGEEALLYIPAAMVAPAFTPEPEEPAPATPDAEAEALQTRISECAREGEELVRQVDALLHCQANAPETITEATVQTAAAQCDKVVALLADLRKTDKEKLTQALEHVSAAAAPAQKAFLQKAAPLLTDAEDPNAAALLNALGCHGGTLPAVVPPVQWGIYATIGGCVMTVFAFILVVFTRRKRRQAQARKAAHETPAQALPPVLSELKNVQTGEVWQIRKPRFTIGRTEGQDAIIKDSSVSSHHCVIELGQNGQWGIYDCHSTNKIFAYGKTVESLPLTDGTVFELGSVKMIFNTTVKNKNK